MITPAEPAIPPDNPPAETSPTAAGARPFSRWPRRALLLGLFVGSGVLGYVAVGWWFSLSRGGPQAQAKGDAAFRHGAAAPLSEMPPAPATPAGSLPAGLPDPAAGLPATRDALAEEAIRVVDLLAEAFPQSPDAWEVRARLMEWLGKSQEAVKCWEKCLALDPKYAYAYLGMGSLAAKKGDHQKAVELLEKAALFDPTSFLARVELGKPSNAPGAHGTHAA